MNKRLLVLLTVGAMVVATLALAGTASAQPSQLGGVTHINSTYVDPSLTSVCGFDVVEHDVGVIHSKSLPNDRFREQVSLRQTLTNPETGTSMVYLTAGPATQSFQTIDQNGSFTQTFTITGLNYLLLGAYPKNVVSSGRGVATFTVLFDRNGNLVDVTSVETSTPHLAHGLHTGVEETICETLAQ